MIQRILPVGKIVATSANGRFILFESEVQHPALGDTNTTSDAYVYDAQSGETRLVSVALDGTAAGNSRAEGISDDGRIVAFTSSAGNLVPGDTNDRADPFFRDLSTGEIHRILSNDVSGTGGWGTYLAMGDGRAVSGDGGAFLLHTANLGVVPSDANHDTPDVVLVGRGGGVTLVSLDQEGGQFGYARSALPVDMSSDGSAVVFKITTSSGNFAMYLRSGGQTYSLNIPFTSTSSDPMISDDGGTILYAGWAGTIVDYVGGNHQYVSGAIVTWDPRFLDSSNPSSFSPTVLIRDAGQADMSADGRFIAFSSAASHHVANDTNDVMDVFVYDRATATTVRVSVAADGTQGDGHSGGAQISADGRWITFGSQATNLAPGDSAYAIYRVENPLFGGSGDGVIRGTPGDDFDLEGTPGADTIEGLGGHDVILGLGGDDTIHAGSGDDQAFGGEGSDTLFGDEGSDYLFGGTEDDTLSGGSEGDFLFGEAGSDTLEGGDHADQLWGDDGRLGDDGSGNGVARPVSGPAGDDYLSGGKGDDMLWGEAGNDILDGGEGADVLWGGSGNNRLDGGTGSDVIFGDTGDDVIFGDRGRSGDQFNPKETDPYLPSEGEDGADRIESDAGDDRIWAGGGDDVVRAGDGSDEIYGESGNDEIHGDGGSDFVSGGDGDDVIYGDAGVDPDGNPLPVHGPAGADLLLGGGGKDEIHGGGERDVIQGGAGNDQLWGDEGDDRVDGGKGNDVVFGGEGDDVLFGDTGRLGSSPYNVDITDPLAIEDGLDGVDLILGGEGADKIFAGGANDLVEGGADDDQLWGEAGDDRLDGGAGSDFIDGGEGSDTIYGDDGPLSNGSPAASTGEAGHDFITGGAGEDWIYGGGGNDLIKGGTEKDRIWGDEGSDTIEGNAGDDIIMGGDGNDVLYGDDGYDASGNPKPSTGPAGDDWLRGGDGWDLLDGGGGSDTLEGEDGSDNLWGRAGDDILYGGAGDDFLFGGADADEIYGGDDNDKLFGNSGADLLDGGAGNDILRGGAGADTLIGGAGDDTIYMDGDDEAGTQGTLFAATTAAAASVGDWVDGGEGDDVIHMAAGGTAMGGAGSDTFVLDGTDVEVAITDFSGGVAGDKLDVSALLHGSADPFASGHLRLEARGTDTVLVYDADGAIGTGGGVDLALIQNVTPSHLTSDNFIAVGPDGTPVMVDPAPTPQPEPVNIMIGTGRANVLTGSTAADAILGLSGNDVLSGRAGNDLLDGGKGRDILYGETGDDRLLGGVGNDLLDGGEGQDTLFGENGDDHIFGGAGNDLLDGGRGNDVLYGGRGSDVLRGGSGNDRFVFELDGGSDVVIDFRAGAGAGDVIDLSQVLAVTSLAELYQHLSSNPAGHAVIDLGVNGSVTLTGVRVSQLAGDDFAFAAAESVSIGLSFDRFEVGFLQDFLFA